MAPEYSQAARRSEHIEPARLTQIARGRDGRMVTISEDVGNVAADLKDISPDLFLRYSEAGGYFVVYYRYEVGGLEQFREHLVLTAQECDQRIVKRVREIDAQNRSGYDFGAELERVEKERAAVHDATFRERIGEASERFWHGIRKAAGMTNRAYVPSRGDE